MTELEFDSEPDVEPALAASSGGGLGPARIASICVGVLLAALIGIFALAPSEEADEASSLLGKRAPAVAGTTMAGEAFDIDDYRGSSWVLVNFFASWCGPCVAEHDDLVELEAWGSQGDGLQLVAAVFNDPPDQVEAFFEERGGSWPVIDDPSIPINYQVSMVPESFLVSPSGEIVYHVEGQLFADDIKRVILGEFNGDG